MHRGDVKTVRQFIGGRGSGKNGGGSGGGPLFVSMLPMGMVRLVGLPLDLNSPPADGRPLACPRTGVVLNAGPEHLVGGSCHIAVVKDIRRGTLDEVSRRCQEIKQAAKDALVASRSGGGNGMPREEVDGRHMGHTKSDLFREFAAAAERGRRGQYLPSDFQYGLQLTTKGANFRGQDLGESVKASRRRRSRK